MKISECSLADEIFGHDDPEDGMHREINATALRKKATGKYPIVRVQMDPEFVEFVKEKRGVEQHKIERLREPYLSEPVLCVQLGDTHLMVDGHHRLVRLFDAGATEYRAILVPEGEWEWSIVTEFDWDQHPTQVLMGQLVAGVEQIAAVKRTIAAGATELRSSFSMFVGEGGDWYDFALKYGRKWLSAPLDPLMTRGTPKLCFMNAARLAQSNLHLTYVEGFGMTPRTPIPIEHAWCVDQAGHVIDTTWDKPEECAYFGVPFTTEYLNYALLASRVYGLMAQTNKELLELPASYFLQSIAETL